MYHKFPRLQSMTRLLLIRLIFARSRDSETGGLRLTLKMKAKGTLTKVKGQRLVVITI